ncbi:MAG TPA: HD domain-containing protein [Chloroflexia bacterium]|nr:HD domain-containing protein [Chloroflexia bacterium]
MTQVNGEVEANRLSQINTREQLILSLVDQPEGVIRDAVWGDIPLSASVMRILDSTPFQRLRGVQQLGFTSWTFPGAHHSRFEHSIGVYHLTRLVLLHLLRRGGFSFTQEEINTTLAAALLHDIGHYPYSHAVEELDLSVIRSHEIIGREIVMGPEIGPILREAWGVDPAKVAAFITKGSEVRLNRREQALRQIISGALDTDKLDYLTRDSHYCNVPYGMVDVQRLIDSLRIWPEPEPSDPGMPLQLTIDEKGVGALQSLIFARYLMFYNVYWHHTNRIATVMFLRSLQEALEQKAFGGVELERSNDASIIALVQNTTPPGSVAHELITDLHERRFYKRALDLSEDDGLFARMAVLKYNPTRRKHLEELWCKMVGEWTGRELRGHEILLDIPEPKGFEIVLNVVCEQPPHGWPNPVPWGEVSGLNNDDMRKFHRHVRRIYIVARDNELAEVVRSRAAMLLDAYRQVE